MPLIEFTDKGLYCAQGQFYIDPWRPVDKAVITHAHSDHARAGNGSYLCHRLTVPLLELRLGPGLALAGGAGSIDAGGSFAGGGSIDAGGSFAGGGSAAGGGFFAGGGSASGGLYQGVEWGEAVYLNGVRVSLHPAGHVIGSSQVRVEYQGEVWVVSGDYKTENDGISGAFEPIRCHVFITESTFGLPIYHWDPQAVLFDSLQSWVADNRARDKTSVLIAYSLGKAQRVLLGLEPTGVEVYVHGAIWNVHQTLLAAGVALPPVQRVLPDMPKEWFRGKAVIAPPSAEGSSWMRRFPAYAVGICSGWMQVRGNVRRRNADAGFAMSDHADWKGLLGAIEATGAEKVFVTHGFQAALSRYLNEKGIEAAEVRTEYGEDEEGGEPADATDADATMRAGDEGTAANGADGSGRMNETKGGTEDAGNA